MTINPEETALPDRSPPGADPDALGDALHALVARRGWGGRLDGAEVHGRWAVIAGDHLNRHTEPVRLVGGVLVVRAADAGWATQVRYLAGDLARRTNEVLGQDLVHRVTVVTGVLRGAPP